MGGSLSPVALFGSARINSQLSTAIWHQNAVGVQGHDLRENGTERVNELNCIGPADGLGIV